MNVKEKVMILGLEVRRVYYVKLDELNITTQLVEFWDANNGRFYYSECKPDSTYDDMVVDGPLFLDYDYNKALDLLEDRYNT